VSSVVYRVFKQQPLQEISPDAPRPRSRDRTCPAWTFFASLAGKRHRISHEHYPRATGRAEDHAWVLREAFALEALSIAAQKRGDGEKSFTLDRTWKKMETIDFCSAAQDITNDLILERRFLPNPHLSPHISRTSS